MSVVGVVHIDCTEIGASPPTSTLPTLILRVLRRGARTGAGAEGMPSGRSEEVSPTGTSALSARVVVDASTGRPRRLEPGGRRPPGRMSLMSA